MTTSLILLGPLFLLVLFVLFWVGVHIWQAQKQARDGVPTSIKGKTKGKRGKKTKVKPTKLKRKRGDGFPLPQPSPLLTLNTRSTSEKSSLASLSVTPPLANDEVAEVNGTSTAGGADKVNEDSETETKIDIYDTEGNTAYAPRLSMHVIAKLKVKAVRVKRLALNSNLLPITWQLTRERVIVSCIVVAVLMHPTLTRRAVQLLTCDTLDGGAYLRSDLEVICWDGEHTWWAMFVGLPFLLAYALGIPFMSWLILYKRRDKLKTDDATIKRFGFLFVGYNWWWWEAVVCYGIQCFLL